MSQHPDVTRARQMLEEQLAALGSLRTGNTRDPVFKQWRQNTLTVIQRLWPGEPARGERFRRVPFSPPSTRAEAREIREYYERGCAEAASYLRLLLGEIEQKGVPASAAVDRPASLDPGVAEDDFPTVDLPGGPVRPPRLEPEPAASGAPAFEMPRVPSSADEPPAPVEPARPRPTRAGTPAAKPAARGAKNGRKAAAKPRLKDMLGFLDEAHVPEATPLEPHQVPESTPVETHEERWPIGEAPEPHDLDSAENVAEVLSAEIDVERAMADFLRLSPVFASKARPVRRPLMPNAGPFTAPAALALAALAADIESLDVPEGHRARARATLLELARHMDSHDLSWEALRDGVNFAMEFPAIGRRVLPLLVPYLERAA